MVSLRISFAVWLDSGIKSTVLLMTVRVTNLNKVVPKSKLARKDNLLNHHVCHMVAEAICDTVWCFCLIYEKKEIHDDRNPITSLNQCHQRHVLQHSDPNLLIPCLMLIKNHQKTLFISPNLELSETKTIINMQYDSTVQKLDMGAKSTYKQPLGAERVGTNGT